MLKEEQLELMADRIYERVKAVNTAYLERIGERYKQLGEISPTDVNRLTRILQWRTSDVAELQALLAKAMNENIKDVENILEGIAKDNYNFAEPFYEAKGVEYVAYAQNAMLVDYANEIIKQTQGTLTNISKTTAIQSSYIEAIDKAVTASTLGLESYSSSIRSAIREVADAGINQVEYDKNGKGYRRRVDTSVRQNVLSAMKQVNLGSSERIGQQFGNDGWEISYHSNPRPSHRAMGGKQYSIKQFEQQGIANLLDDYNCLHYKYPIIMGVSQPAYDKKELTELKEKDILKVDYKGKQCDRYEMSQIQRKLETAIRKEKDAAVLAGKADNMPLRREIQVTIDRLTAQYEEVSKVAGLPTKVERMTVAGFRPVKANVTKAKVPSGSVSKTPPKVEPKVDKFKFERFENIDDAKKYVNKHLGLDTVLYNQINIDVANEFNLTVTEIFNEFTEFADAKYFDGVLVQSRKSSAYAAYASPLRQMWLFKQNVGYKSSIKKLAADAKEMKNIGFWSTSDLKATFRHEMGHSIHFFYMQNYPERAKKIQQYFDEIFKKTGIGTFNKDVYNKEDFEKAGAYLSYYAMMNDKEFVAEAIAEYMTGKPREVAETVVKILKGEK